MIATDHAPHAENEKSKGLEKSAMGVVGLETAFAAVYTTMVKSGMISIERLVKIMTINARRILGLPMSAGINPRNNADLTLLDISAEWTVDPRQFAPMGTATPYDGMTLTGCIAATIHNGEILC